MTNKKPLILSIDQGTTSSRAVLFETNGTIFTQHQIPLDLIMPQNGWVEQNPNAIWNDTLKCIQTCIDMAQQNNRTIASIGITNQRETTISWDKKTGKPLYNAIVWQDRRTAKYTQQLKDKGHEQTIQEKTGLLLDPYFSASKIKWILDNAEGAQDKADKGQILFGTIDTFLLWHLTGGKIHATDATNAARTSLFNIHTLEWDNDLLNLFNIPKNILPIVHENAHDFGTTAPSITKTSIPIQGMAGDQHAALIGQGCFEKGEIKSTYGTGCFMVMNTGKTAIQSTNKLLGTIGYIVNGKTTYALEGSIFVAGSLIQWLRDNLELINDAAQTEGIANALDDNGGVYVVPALTGMGAPHWDADATGTITGLRRSTTKNHIIRAACEAQAYQTHDLINAMQNDANVTLSSIRADGGLMSNSFIAQYIADILNLPLHIPKNTEATAWGAAILAGVQAGIFESLEATKPSVKSDTVFTPKMENTYRDKVLNEWQTALQKALMSED